MQEAELQRLFGPRSHCADLDNRACDCTAGHCAESETRRRVTQNCASCHAIGRNGESPNKSAPAFRSLGQRYPIESLEEALGEGIMSGHPDMPEFTFDAKDVGAIIAYLKSIQQR
jgi:mono/diheme cytochrome c family protein